jgi:hypothetical protein
MRQRLYQWAIIPLAAVAFAFGGLWWRERALVSAYRDESVCWRICHDDTEAYRDLSAHVTSHPKAAVVGEVGSEAERARLERELTEQLGPGRRPKVNVHVRVRSPTSDPL